MCKKDYSWNPNTCICESSRHIKSIVDVSVIVDDQIISITNCTWTNVTISTIVTSTVSINSDDEKVRCKMDT